MELQLRRTKIIATLGPASSSRETIAALYAPGAAAGIKPGETIFAIDKDPIYDLTLSEVEQKLSGPVDSEVTLTGNMLALIASISARTEVLNASMSAGMPEPSMMKARNLEMRVWSSVGSPGVGDGVGAGMGAGCIE